MSWDVREGMVVHTSDGERLGTVVRRGDDTFVIAKGRLLPRDFIARYEEIAEVRDGEVHLRRSREDMIPGPLLKGREHEAVVQLGTFGAPQEIVVELAHGPAARTRKRARSCARCAPRFAGRRPRCSRRVRCCTKGQWTGCTLDARHRSEKRRGAVAARLTHLTASPRRPELLT